MGEIRLQMIDSHISSQSMLIVDSVDFAVLIMAQKYM